MNELTKQILRDLQQDIEMLMNCESDIEVAWGLEKLHVDNALIKSAKMVIKSLSYETNKNR